MMRESSRPYRLMRVAKVPLIFRPLCLILSAVIILAAFSSSGVSAGEPEIADLERQILVSRRLIKSGEFKIDVTSSYEFRPEAHYHTWFAEGGRIRQELRFKKDLQVSLFNPESAAFYSTRGAALEDPMLVQRPPLRLLLVAAHR